MATALVSDLRTRHRGPVIDADDTAYEVARMTFNGMIDRRPQLIVRPLDVDDVVTAVSFAAANDLPIAVRGGGHSVAGHCIGDGALVVDLRLMRSVVVNPETRRATCGGGALWEDLDPPCQREGLATPGGTFGDTGVGGLTLGGGIGHLIGLHGLTLDNLAAATVVTANGDVVRATEQENEDLFWALRGGGGNFGVVIDFTFDVHPVGQLLGGLLMYPLENASEMITRLRDLMATAPDELMCFAVLARDALTNKNGLFMSVAYFGDPDDGREAIGHMLEGPTPSVDAVRPMYYPELQEIFGRSPFGNRNYWSGRFVRELADEVIQLTGDYFADPDVYGGILVEPLHGAAARVTSDATAFAGREAKYNLTYTGTWRDPADDEKMIGLARGYSSALAPWAIGGGYVNYASELASDTTETEYGTRRFARLREIKRQYDPDNRFRFNHNISPE